MEKHEKKKIVFFIEQKKHETQEESLTVRQILVDFAKVDPERYTLALKQQGGFHEYDNLDEPIEMKEGMHFSLFDKKPTPVS
jgi:hypothetical protein